MSSTAANIATGMEIIAALGMLSFYCPASHAHQHRHAWADLFYDIRLNVAVALFQLFASQMLGYGIAGLRELSMFWNRSVSAQVIPAH